LTVHRGACGDDLRDTLREPVGNAVALLNRRDNGKSKVRLAGCTLVELIRVAVNVRRGRRGEANVEGVEVRQRRLPRAVDGAVALVRNHNVEVAAGELMVAANHRLQQADGDL